MYRNLHNNLQLEGRVWWGHHLASYAYIKWIYIPMLINIHTDFKNEEGMWLLQTLNSTVYFQRENNNYQREYWTMNNELSFPS